MSVLGRILRVLQTFEGREVNRPPVPPPTMVVQFVESDEVITDHLQAKTVLPFARSVPYKANVIGAERIVDETVELDVNCVYELTLQIEDLAYDYLPGDTVSVMPRNSSGRLELLRSRCTTMAAKFDSPVLLSASPTGGRPKLPEHFPTVPTTLRNIFETAVEFNFLPKKNFLAALVEHNCVTEEKERRALLIFASRDGASSYATEIFRRHCTFLTLLKALTSWNFNEANIWVLLEHMPRLMPRAYSICTNVLSTKQLPDYDPKATILKIIFSMHTPLGMSTQLLQRESEKYIAKLAGPYVELYFRNWNNFRLTEEDLNMPIIMVATGTGIAPFIGFLEYIAEHNRRGYPAHKNQDRYIWLVYGCRHRSTQIYADKLRQFTEDGIITRFDECFSRDADESAPAYVQHALRSRSTELIERLVTNPTGVSKSRMYVCGSKSVLANVREFMMEAIVRSLYAENEAEAQDFLEKLMDDSNYVQDTWY